jgi:translation initiation factor 3 subunit G
LHTQNSPESHANHFFFQIYSNADWADDDEYDDPSALPATQITENKDGTKTVVSYRFNDDNKKVKVTRRIKATVVREHVNPQVAERRSWAKFGLEKGHAPGPSFDTTSVGENMVFRPSTNWKAQAADAEKNPEQGSMKDQLKDKKVKCRICSGEHFTARCPFKDTMAPVEEPTGGADMGADEDGAAGGLGAGSSSYVPPHMRGKAGGAAGEKMGGRFEKDDLATLRVTNVCAFRPSSDLWFYPNILSFIPTGQRVGRGTGVARSLRAVRSCHQSFPCPGPRNPAGQGLCFHQLCGSGRCCSRLRENGRLYVFIPFGAMVLVISRYPN